MSSSSPPGNHHDHRSPSPSGRASNGDFIRSNFRSTSPSRPVSFDVQQFEDGGTPDWMKRLLEQKKAEYRARWGELPSDLKHDSSGSVEVSEKSPGVEVAIEKYSDVVDNTTIDAYSYEEITASTYDEEPSLPPPPRRGGGQRRRPQEESVSSGSNPVVPAGRRTVGVTMSASTDPSDPSLEGPHATAGSPTPFTQGMTSSVFRSTESMPTQAVTFDQQHQQQLPAQPKQYQQNVPWRYQHTSNTVPPEQRDEATLRAELAALEAKLVAIRLQEAELEENPPRVVPVAAPANQATLFSQSAPPSTLEQQLSATRERQFERRAASPPRSSSPMRQSSPLPRSASPTRPTTILRPPTPPRTMMGRSHDEHDGSLCNYVIEIDTLSSSRQDSGGVGTRSYYELDFGDSSTIPSRLPVLRAPPSIDEEEETATPPTPPPRNYNQAASGRSQPAISEQSRDNELSTSEPKRTARPKTPAKKPRLSWRRAVGMSMCCCALLLLLLGGGIGAAYLLDEGSLSFLPFIDDEDGADADERDPGEKLTASPSASLVSAPTPFPTDTPRQPAPDSGPQPTPDEPSPPEPTDIPTSLPTIEMPPTIFVPPMTTTNTPTVAPSAQPTPAAPEPTEPAGTEAPPTTPVTTEGTPINSAVPPAPLDGEWRLISGPFVGLNANTGFGESLAMDGNILAVGAPRDGDGSVQVYSRSNGLWGALNSVTPSQTAQADDFGAAMAISVGTSRVVMIVGAPRSSDTQGFGLEFGAAFYYELTGPSWTQRGTRLAPVPTALTASGRAGASVAVAADSRRMAMGAPGISFDLDNLDNGQVFLYEFDGTSMNQLGILDGMESGEQFGTSLSMTNDGNRVLIGAPGTPGDSAGAAYYYEWNGAVWNDIFALPGTGLSDNLGTTVAILDADLDGDVIAMGAPNGDGTRGYIRIYQRVFGSFWGILGNDIVGDVGDFLGTSLSAASGTRLVAGTASGTFKAYEYQAAQDAWIRVGTSHPALSSSITGIATSSSGDVAIGLADETMSVYGL